MPRYKFRVFFVLLLLLISVIISCKKVPVQGVTLLPRVAYVPIGGSVTLTASIIPEDAYNKAVTWSSNDTLIAIVADGLVTGVSKGRATITVTTVDGARTATCAITVYIPVEIEMVLVEGGTFTMGCSDDECDLPHLSDESPQHKVTLSTFQISKYLVTQKLWVDVMGYTRRVCYDALNGRYCFNICSINAVCTFSISDLS